MSAAPNDHAGLVYMLDAAGRTIMDLEGRVEHLTAQVAQLDRDRDMLAHLLAEARANACDDPAHVPPPSPGGDQNGAHAAPADQPDPATAPDAPV